MKVHDVIIVGGGPAGLAAGIYAGRAKLSALLIEKSREGGQIGFASSVENYPGGLAGEDGMALADRMAAQCRGFGVEFARAEAEEYDIGGGVKIVKAGGSEYLGKTVIIATGSAPARLNVPGEEEFIGRGVSYCATCDAPFFTDADVFVAGGGDSALEEAAYLAKFARKVTVIHRRDRFRAAKSIQAKAIANEKIVCVMDSVIKEVRGGDLLGSIVVENVKTGEARELRGEIGGGAMGLFIFVGMKPNTGPLEGLVGMEGGYVATDEEMRTDVPGVFAAGDVRRKSLRQVVTAAADGAAAAVSADRYISERAE
jgi:thioredoxin reductase (NADPH)